MFREMRRSAQQLTHEECLQIIDRATAGVLALSGDEGYPYAVPLSYVYVDGTFYFHCAKVGHKIDAIRSCDKASFCIVDRDEVIPEEYTTYFRSVIAFGRVRILDDGEEIMRAIDMLAARYAPQDSAENRHAAIARELNGLCMLALNVEHMTGKQARELMQRQRAAQRED